jgi:hypothetical protein
MNAAGCNMKIIKRLAINFACFAVIYFPLSIAAATLFHVPINLQHYIIVAIAVAISTEIVPMIRKIRKRSQGEAGSE